MQNIAVHEPIHILYTVISLECHHWLEASSIQREQSGWEVSSLSQGYHTQADFDQIKLIFDTVIAIQSFVFWKQLLSYNSHFLCYQESLPF